MSKNHARLQFVFGLFTLLLFSFLSPIESWAGDGELKWVFQTGGHVTPSPAIASDGTIYVGSYDDNLYAINPDGTQKWAFRTRGDVLSSPAIGSDGTIYVGSHDNNFYAIESSSRGLANSPWPIFHHDLKHTGRAQVAGR